MWSVYQDISEPDSLISSDRLSSVILILQTVALLSLSIIVKYTGVSGTDQDQDQDQDQ